MSRQATLLEWAKKKKKEIKMYRFLMDFPEGIMTPRGPAGPFKKGDIVSESVMHEKVWQVLLVRGAVEVYRTRT